MERIAGDGLLNLRQQRLGIADQQIADMFAMLEFRLQKSDRAANHAALELNQTSVEGNATVHRCEQAEGSFAPDVGGLDSRAVLQHGEQREHGALRKIGVLENPARLANHVTELEHHRLQMGRDPREAGSLHRAEQSIAPRSIAWLALGHNSFFGHNSFLAAFTFTTKSNWLVLVPHQRYLDFESGGHSVRTAMGLR